MKKQILETFIKKYSLGGNIESVKWIISNKEFKTTAATCDKSVLIDVKLSDFTDMSDAEIGIYDTPRLKQMLGVLGDEITVSTNTNINNKIISLSLVDTDTEVQYVTADLSVIPPSFSLKKLPPFNVEIELNEDFIAKFIKAKNALSDVDTFTLAMNKKNVLEFIIGYSNINSNKIRLDVKTADGLATVAKPISFSAKYLKDILVSNNDCESSILKVSDSGLATLSFNKDNFSSTYYLVESTND
jgi:hypothetical protein